MAKKSVLITGASGLIGGLTLAALGEKYEFSGLSRRPVEGIPHLSADIADAEGIKTAFRGIHTVLHLAAANGPDESQDWGATMRITVQGTLNVYEAAREAGVKRVIHMSSGCAQLAYEWDDSLPYGTLAEGPDDEIPNAWEMIEVDWPVRPDSPYAVGKLFGENLGRYYADRHGLSTIVIRLGAVLQEDRPLVRRHYPGFLSQADCLQMIERCIDAPDDLRFDVFNAISENQWRWRSTDHTTRVLGWKPTGSADKFDLPA